eukprot:m.165339 g.165339  ORF g.165339 m.165339 type:complete len:342 (-) comp18135_c0_seq2:23-1048(-)
MCRQHQWFESSQSGRFVLYFDITQKATHWFNRTMYEHTWTLGSLVLFVAIATKMSLLKASQSAVVESDIPWTEFENMVFVAAAGYYTLSVATIWFTPSDLLLGLRDCIFNTLLFPSALTLAGAYLRDDVGATSVYDGSNKGVLITYRISFLIGAVVLESLALYHKHYGFYEDIFTQVLWAVVFGSGLMYTHGGSASDAVAVAFEIGMFAGRNAVTWGLGRVLSAYIWAAPTSGYHAVEVTEEFDFGAKTTDDIPTASDSHGAEPDDSAVDTGGVFSDAEGGGDSNGEDDDDVDAEERSRQAAIALQQADVPKNLQFDSPGPRLVAAVAQSRLRPRTPVRYT